MPEIILIGGRDETTGEPRVAEVTADGRLLVTGGGGTDPNAIHDNVAGEIAAVAEKVVPANADLVLIEDSAAGNAKRRLQIGNMPGGGADVNAVHVNAANEISGVAAKAAPVGADLIIIEDSAAGNIKKSVQLTNLPYDDPDAIHDNVAGEIAAIAAKGAPINADLIVIEDSAAGNVKKSVQLGNLPYPTAAPASYAYLGFGTDATLTAEVNVLAMQLTNEFRNFPTYTPIDIDLAAGGLWYDSIGTPTTAPTMIDIAGEGGITETWEYAIKCVTDASGEGWEQVYTYADEHRVKAGRYLSGLFAVWVVTPGRTVTATFRNSTGETTTGTATAQAWTVVEVAGHLLAGNSVDVEFTIDGSDTFYVVPLGLCIGMRGVPLKSRGMQYRDWTDTCTEIKSLTGIGDEDAWTDIDVSAQTGNLATRIFGKCDIYDGSDTFALYFRRNGSAAGKGTGNLYASCDANARTERVEFILPLDDGNILEYLLDRTGGAGTLDSGHIYLLGWWEWE